MNTLNLNIVKQDKPETVVRESVRPEMAYIELPGLRHETKDVLKQLDSNIALLEDLGGRLGFVLAEVRGLIRRP